MVRQSAGPAFGPKSKGPLVLRPISKNAVILLPARGVLSTPPRQKGVRAPVEMTICFFRVARRAKIINKNNALSYAARAITIHPIRHLITPSGNCLTGSVRDLCKKRTGRKCQLTLPRIKEVPSTLYPAERFGTTAVFFPLHQLVANLFPLNHACQC